MEDKFAVKKPAIRVYEEKQTFIILSTSMRLADCIDAVSSLYVDI